MKYDTWCILKHLQVVLKSHDGGRVWTLVMSVALVTQRWPHVSPAVVFTQREVEGELRTALLVTAVRVGVKVDLEVNDRSQCWISLNKCPVQKSKKNCRIDTVP